MSDKLDYIDEFFKSKPSAEEIHLFEKHVAQDPDLADDLAFYLSTIQTLRFNVSEAKKDHFKALYYQQQHSVKPVTRLWAYISAAAAILLIFIAVFYYSGNKPPDAVAQSYIDKNLSTLPVMMNSTEDSVQRGVRLYNENKLDQALHTFERILQNNRDEYKVMEYAGLVSLRMDNYDKALMHFQQLSKATSLYANAGDFYVSLTLMKRNRPGDVQQAKALLKRIVDEHAANEEAARELLKQL
jgi:tetratricopeptide (TPR) repeat protein